MMHSIGKESLRYLVCSLIVVCSTTLVSAETDDKIVLVLAKDAALDRNYSTAWAKAHLIEPLIDDARAHKVAYSLPYCEEEQTAQCEIDANIKLVIEVYGLAGGLEDIASSLVTKYPDLPLAAYRVRERQPRAYIRDWPLGEATPGVRRVALMVKKDHLTTAEFEAYWSDQHTPLALEQPVAVWNYLQNVVTKCQGACGNVDGIVFQQFRNTSDIQDRWRKTLWLQLESIWDANKFMDILASRTQSMTERVVKDSHGEGVNNEVESVTANQ